MRLKYLIRIKAHQPGYSLSELHGTRIRCHNEATALDKLSVIRKTC